MIKEINDDFGNPTKVGDYVIHHVPSPTPSKDMICSKVIGLSGKTKVVVDMIDWSLNKEGTLGWFEENCIKTNRFIKVPETFAKDHYDFGHMTGYNSGHTFKRLDDVLSL
jgi:hypothetical protein